MTEKKREQIELQCYWRTFSDLGAYQKPHGMVYHLYQQENECLFVITRQGELPKSIQVGAHIPVGNALQLLTLLYENAVSLELCCDVLAEYGVGVVS